MLLVSNISIPKYEEYELIIWFSNQMCLKLTNCTKRFKTNFYSECSIPRNLHFF